MSTAWGSRAVYPAFPELLSEETLMELATLESAEKSFVQKTPQPRHQYLRALYLKGMGHLGHAHYHPASIPRQLRLRLVEELDLARELVTIRRLERRDKSRLVREVRIFLGLSRYTYASRLELGRWLEETPARRQSEPLELVGAAIEHLREQKVELPSHGELTRLAQRALARADARLAKELAASLSEEEARKLESLLEDGATRTPLDVFKDPIPRASVVNLRTELERLRTLGEYRPRAEVLTGLTRSKVEQLAQVASRSLASELGQLRPARRRSLLSCYVVWRFVELLDAVADLLIRVWEQTKHTAENHADEQQRALASHYEEHRKVLRELVDIIRSSGNEAALWRKVHTLRNRAEYEDLAGELEAGVPWTECYIRKIRDHYQALRRALPLFYELVPIVSTTTGDEIPRAIQLLGEHGEADSPTLPVTDTPTSFLAPEWAARAISRHRWTGRITAVLKAPYELGLVEALVRGFGEGTLAVTGARRYAPMTEHLLPQDEFLQHYGEHLATMERPERASDYYDPLREDLARRLVTFDRRYPDIKTRFWVNRDGTLSFSRPPAAERPPQRVEKLRLALLERMPRVSILDILLDCHRLTGYLDSFRPITGRQNMSEVERVHQLLATLYAYGCNCGPTQAAWATGLAKNQIIYMRRRYTGTRQLTEAASTLAEAYLDTALAGLLGDPGILLTDSMRFPTLEESFTARSHHRYRQGKNIMLFQHVTPACVCIFTRALLCNVSEAIEMLHGILMARHGSEPVINICDSAGKSDLVFGLSELLNIQLWPRLRSHNLKLWGAAAQHDYENISAAISAPVRWNLIDEGWQDMMWVLASISAGTAPPALIVERLAAQTHHPATLGFQELGKAARSTYLLRYGMQMEFRRFVVQCTARREHWNYFARSVFHAFGGLVHEKSLDAQEEIFWFLTVVQNAIVLWNALGLQMALGSLGRKASDPEEEDLRHILPTMLEHINFVGRFELDLDRRLPFAVAA